MTSFVVLAASTGFRLLSGQSVAYVVGYELVGHAALIAAVIALGYSVRVRREIETRTEQVARLAARQSVLRAEERLRDERLRLARELHDSIGHSLSVASLYANVADESTDPVARHDALQHVRGAVSDSMTQVRSTVTLLRAPAEPAEQREPRLADVPRLLDPLSTAGYGIDVDIADVEAGPSVEAVAFRIVQEALTNTLRHSNATRVSVSLTPDGPDGMRLTVTDDGTRTRAPRFVPGHGLSGMRERAQAIGGNVTVDATSDGWVVTAVLPLKEGT